MKKILTIVLVAMLVVAFALPAVGCTDDATDGATNSTDGTKGDTGAQGIPGEQGEQGIPGVDGIDGVDGVDGVDGADGVDGTFPYTIQMGTCTFNVDDTFTGGYHKMEVPVTFDPSFGSIPLVFVTATSGTRTNTDISLWDVAAIDATLDGFILKVGSDMEKVSATVTVNWLAIS